jgi:hypothetical protein
LTLYDYSNSPSTESVARLRMVDLERGLFYLVKRWLPIPLDEHPSQIVRNTETTCLDLKFQTDPGSIDVLFDSPRELNIYAHSQRSSEPLRTRTSRSSMERQVIGPHWLIRLSTAISFMPWYCWPGKHRLMTTFFSNENLEFLGLSPFMPDFAVSLIVDNIIMLSLVEINSTFRSCLTVVKAEGIPHEFDSREYVIGRGGITLLPFDEKVAKALPLAGYAGILNRAPARLPAAPQPLAAAATRDSR